MQSHPDRHRHELTNQLGIILGFTQLLLLEMDLAHRWRNDIQRIEDAAQRAIELLASGDGHQPS